MPLEGIPNSSHLVGVGVVRHSGEHLQDYIFACRSDRRRERISLGSRNVAFNDTRH